MGNYLKMVDRQRILALLELKWSYRRIERETGVRRETIAGYDPRHRSKPAKVITGSAPGNEDAGAQKRPEVITGSASASVGFHAEIEAGVKRGLTAQRIWQDLCAEHGFSAGYQSVQRYSRRLRRRRPEVADVMEHPPGKEGQVDYFREFGTGVQRGDGKMGAPVGLQDDAELLAARL